MAVCTRSRGFCRATTRTGSASCTSSMANPGRRTSASHLIASCAHADFAGSRFAAEAVAVQRGERSIWDAEAKACDGFGHAETA